ncbi:MAG: alpha-glucosidase, partial [Janthinobacterium lividum]
MADFAVSRQPVLAQRYIRSGLTAWALILASLHATAQTPTPPSTHKAWWDGAVIYEIYPRSFQDSNADGVGDLKGITQRLDYIKQLGVDAIWLTPIYPSPQVDFGYDISDYTAIDPLYGTMNDFEHLMAEAKKRHIRVIMDLVLNHTSDQHPWFVESASSRSNPKREWYIWRDGLAKAEGSMVAPNNWVNRIEQSAWRFFPETGQFNYHYYAPEQPDLNWRNPEVQAAMFRVVRFWLDKGVDGFRLDAINTLFEREDLRDEAPVPGTNEYGEPSLSMIYQRNLPEVHDVMRNLRQLTDSYPGDRLLIGEVYTKTTAEFAAWYGSKGEELQLPMDTNIGFLNKLDAAEFRKLLTEAESIPRRTPLFVFDNHDRPRSWDRYGDGVHNLEIAKVLATILLASRSSALIYQGEELGMDTATPSRKENVRDPRGIAGWPKEKGRDGERTPMQWNTGSNAGFSAAAKTWLPVEDNARLFNVQAEVAQPGSLLRWYESLLRLRKENAQLLSGEISFLDHDAQGALVWIRKRLREDSCEAGVLVANNLTAEPIVLDLKADLHREQVAATSVTRVLCSFSCEKVMHIERIV